MNIALAPWIYFPTVGGVQTNVRNLAKDLVKKGHTVIIITTRYPPETNPLDIIDGIRVYRLPFMADNFPLPKSVVRRRLKFLKEIILIPPTLLRLWLIAKKNKIQIINVHFEDLNAFYVTLISYLCDFKYIITLRGYSNFRMPLLGYSRKWIFHWNLKRADRIISVSKSVLQQSLKECPQLAEKALVINNSIDFNEFENTERFPHANPYILFIGRMQRRKGFDILLFSYKTLLDQGYAVDLVATDSPDNPETECYKKLIRLLGLEERVILVGEVNKANIVKLLNGCQFVVLPSRADAAATVILETMAAGKAIVATAVDGTPEFVVNGENGILVKPNSPDALAAGMKELLDNPGYAQIMGRKGKTMVEEKFTLDKMMDSYLKVYTD